MPHYTFETISAGQALALRASDTLTIGGVLANEVTVRYNPGGTITIVAGARSVEFGAPLASVSLAGGFARLDGARLFIGDDGPNTSSAPEGAHLVDALFGGAGNDVLDGGRGDDKLQGNAGGDTLVGGTGRDVLYGGQDNDIIYTTLPSSQSSTYPAADGGDFAQGNKGNDILYGGLDADTLIGGQGNDAIHGFTGANVLNGNLGDDLITGSGTLSGEDGSDTLQGVGLNDTLIGGEGADRFLMIGGYGDGGAGDDLLADSSRPGSKSTILGGDGADTISGLFVSNSYRTEHTYFGGAGDDSLEGSMFADTLSGGSGNDTLGGDGSIGTYYVDDVLVYDAIVGVDRLSGGEGDDRFVIYSRSTNPLPLDAADIVDWERTDRIEFVTDRYEGATAATYREITSSSFEAAYASAEALRQEGIFYLAAQVGDDVIVFATRHSLSHDGAVLVGRTLDDIAHENIL